MKVSKTLKISPKLRLKQFCIHLVCPAWFWERLNNHYVQKIKESYFGYNFLLKMKTDSEIVDLQNLIAMYIVQNCFAWAKHDCKRKEKNYFYFLTKVCLGTLFGMTGTLNLQTQGTGAVESFQVQKRAPQAIFLISFCIFWIGNTKSGTFFFFTTVVY